MHIANMKAWLYCKAKYAKYFSEVDNIVEFGSHNVNGTIRNLFSGYKKYIGIDWRAGPNVDMVSLAHEAPLNDLFDTVASSSLLEHDPYWEKTIRKMVSSLKEDGCIMLSWGSALNPQHCHEHACDGLFHPLPVKSVTDLLEQLGVYVHELKYEGNIPGVLDEDCVSNRGMGEVVLIAFKDKKYALGDRNLDELTPEDALLRPIPENIPKKGKPKEYLKANREELMKISQFFPKPDKSKND